MEKEAIKEKDPQQVVRQLSVTFAKATESLERAFRGKKAGPNQAYSLQTEFAYRLNEITQGPRCMLNKNIADANDFIDEVVTSLNK